VRRHGLPPAGSARRPLAVFQREGRAPCSGADLAAGAPGDLSLQVDVTDERQVLDMYAAALERFGRIDVLFNNAGHLTARRTARCSTRRLEGVGSVCSRPNLRGVFLCCKHGHPAPAARGRRLGHQTRPSFVGRDGAAATSQISYTASKGRRGSRSHASWAWSSRAAACASTRCAPVRRHARLLQELYASDPEQAERRLVHVPIGRFARAEEIANGALFLASGRVELS